MLYWNSRLVWCRINTSTKLIKCQWGSQCHICHKLQGTSLWMMCVGQSQRHHIDCSVAHVWQLNHTRRQLPGALRTRLIIAPRTSVVSATTRTNPNKDCQGSKEMGQLSVLLWKDHRLTKLPGQWTGVVTCQCSQDKGHWSLINAFRTWDIIRDPRKMVISDTVTIVVCVSRTARTSNDCDMSSVHASMEGGLVRSNEMLTSDIA